ncbi:hypothetical protein CPB84DRAFT_1495947 [Gymnopilus junonius]|uniref:Uncharacterized protein n=1 Tax=Gymnopilus junonius TaxID=109634 RepID=A0A9P5NU22_GYMJU|nr:hypothetical protein CPB84DRAFT_1495947 [Gymnopilus junonius]
MMLLVELPAIDPLPVPALPSLGFRLPSCDFGLVHTLTRPSTWLALLATLVIVSFIRAALLYLRPPSWTESRKSVSFVRIVKEEKVTTTVSEGTATTSASVQVESKVEAAAAAAAPAVGAAPQGKKMSSWFWGLVKWDSLPSAPSIPGRMVVGWLPPPSPLRRCDKPNR